LYNNQISRRFELNIYSHVMPEIKKAAAMKLNSLFEDIKTKGNHS